MKKKLLLLILMVLPLFIASCSDDGSDDDGKVDPMKWKTEVKKSSDGYFNVSSQGGTFVFQCTNYSDFWITGVTEQEAKGEEKKFTPAYDDHEDLTITANWTTATRNGNTLTVTILPTTSNANRFIKVSVQNGDAFDEFKFKLRGLKVGL